MDTRISSQSATPSPKAPGVSSHKKTVKALLRAVAVFGLAAGVFWPAALRAGEVKNRERVESDSGTVVQKAFAIIGQPAQAQSDQAAAESSRWTVSAPDTPVRVAGAPSVDPSAAPAAPSIADKTVSTAPAALVGHSFGVGDKLKIDPHEKRYISRV